MNKTYLLISLLLSQLTFSQDFTMHTVELLPNTCLRGLEVVDLNNDNHLDLVSLGNCGLLEISTWFNDGSGNFGAKQLIDDDFVNAGSAGDDIAIVDFNNDGFLDVVAAISINYQATGYRIVWYPNNQDGTFGPRVIIDNGGWASNAIVIFDVDNNGFNDIIIGDREFSTTTGYITYSLYYLPNQGNGIFGSKTIILNDERIQGLSAGFFNDDLYEDLVYTNYQGVTVKVLINNGNGTFAAPSTINNTLTETNYVSVGRIDGDTQDDILVSELNKPETLSWFSGNGDGTFGSKSILSGGDYDLILNSAISDIDNDGDNDIISVAQHTNDLVWFKNKGNGAFGPANSIGTLDNNGNYDVKTGDINEDGKLDIILTNQEGLFWFENSTTLHIKDYNNDINIYPNPSNKVVFINKNNLIIYKIELFDLTGKVIQTKIKELEMVNLTDVLSGIYILKIHSDKGIIMKKLMKE